MGNRCSCPPPSIVPGPRTAQAWDNHLGLDRTFICRSTQRAFNICAPHLQFDRAPCPGGGARALGPQHDLPAEARRRRRLFRRLPSRRSRVQQHQLPTARRHHLSRTRVHPTEAPPNGMGGLKTGQRQEEGGGKRESERGRRGRGDTGAESRTRGAGCHRRQALVGAAPVKGGRCPPVKPLVWHMVAAASRPTRGTTQGTFEERNN